MDTYPILKHMLYSRKLYETLFTDFRSTVEVSQTEIDILGFLSNHPDMNTSIQIAEYRMIPKANISKAVESLHQKGLLVTQRDHEDRRRVYLHLTEQAEPIIAQIQMLQQHYRSALTKGFSREELELCETFLERMTINAQEQIKEGDHGKQ